MENTSTHHNLHHAKFKGNYGLYFRTWDRLMDTEHPDYVAEYDKIQKRRFGENTALPFSWKGIFSVFFILLTGLALLSVKASVDDMEGKWKSDKTGAIILIDEKDGLYFG